MKKIFLSLTLAFFIMSSVLSNYAYALSEIPALESKSIVLMEPVSGQILYENNADEERIPASVTKLMTLLLVFEALENNECSLADVVTASAYASSMGGTQIYLAEGEKMTLEELIIAIAVGSANDAAVAVAEYLAGSEEAFVALMNTKAKDLGMNNTNFMNPNGLPADNHYTTARDLSLLVREIVNKYPQILNYTSLKSYTLREDSKPFELYNKNKLLWWYEGADGLKTGWIGEESGYNVAATATKDEMRLAAIVLGAEKTYDNFYDAMKLFNWGFENYTYQKLFAQGEEIASCAVQKGEQREVKLVASADIGILSAKEEQQDLRAQLTFVDINAPVQKGEILGIVKVYAQDECLGSYNVCAAEDVAALGFFGALKRVGSYFFS